MLIRTTHALIFVSLLFIVAGASGQIRNGFPSLTCRDEEIDQAAKCTTIVTCTKPPNTLDGFVIGGFVFRTCPNQPVINIARTDGAVGGSQESASATATSLFYGRRIQGQIRLGDCNGQNQLVLDFNDPQGCNPPAPLVPGFSDDPCLGGSGGGFTADGGPEADAPPLMTLLKLMNADRLNKNRGHLSAARLPSPYGNFGGIAAVRGEGNQRPTAAGCP